MIIGEAAGLAASMANDADSDVQDVNTSALTERLREVGAIMELKKK